MGGWVGGVSRVNNKICFEDIHTYTDNFYLHSLGDLMFFLIFSQHMEQQTDGQTDGPTDEPIDKPILICSETGA